MLLVIFCLVIDCKGILILWTPIELYNIQILTQAASFGDPSLVPRYGTIVIMDEANSCLVTSLVINSFAVFYNYSSCSYSDLAQNVQNAGGIGLIIVSSSDTINNVIISKTYDSGINITIAVFMISSTDGLLLIENNKNKI